MEGVTPGSYCPFFVDSTPDPHHSWLLLLYQCCQNACSWRQHTPCQACTLAQLRCTLPVLAGTHLGGNAFSCQAGHAHRLTAARCTLPFAAQIGTVRDPELRVQIVSERSTFDEDPAAFHKRYAEKQVGLGRALCCPKCLKVVKYLYIICLPIPSP
jgi:hypothetical protein